MRPLYDRTASLVGWEDEQGHLFDTAMAWIAFTAGGHLFMAGTLVWLGPRRGLSLLDRTGKPVLWSPGAAIESHIHPRAPIAPKRPMRPKTPIRPIQPLPPQAPRPPTCGWSALLAEAWLAQGIEPPTEPSAEPSD